MHPTIIYNNEVYRVLFFNENTGRLLVAAINGTTKWLDEEAVR
jgi:hypothetical protein